MILIAKAIDISLLLVFLLAIFNGDMRSLITSGLLLTYNKLILMEKENKDV